MASKNISDIIEAYIKSLLEQTGLAELKRAHLADVFHVVPSQINYVIKTRFTEQHGYVVESKRGGGGYIRIARLNFSDQHHLLKHLLGGVDERVSEPVFAQVLDYLCEEQVVTAREAQLIFGLVTDDLLGSNGNCLRAKMLRRLLNQLDRKRDR